MSRVLGRRTLLRGALRGAAISVALPPLEAMLDAHGEAWADGEPIAKRFGTWFWGQGVKADRWTPATRGTAWQASPPPSLRPFADAGVIDQVSVVTNTWVPFQNYNPPHFRNLDHIHTASQIELLSGPDPVAGNYNDIRRTGPDVLDVIRKFLAGKTRLEEVRATVSRAGPPSSVLVGNPASTEQNPQALFNQLFGGGVPGTSPSPALLGARRSVLDAVAQDAVELRKRVGGADRRRLDDHLEGIHELERTIAALPSSCTAPANPGPRPADTGMREPLEQLNRALADLVAHALACDLTRFFRFTFSRPQSNVVFWQVGLEREYHEFGHSEPGAQPQVQKCVEFMMKQCAYFVARLRSIPVGAGTLLDHCCVWAYSEVNDPQQHQLFGLPNLVIGRAGGALRGGVHHNAGGVFSNSARTTVPEAIHTRLLLTMMRALDMPQASFGAGNGHADKVMPELMTAP
jgi:hypothetical protein